MHLGDEVGPREHELLVAALEREAAEVVGAEVVALHPGAERPVEHEHALTERIEERRLGAATDRGVRATGVNHQTRVGAPIRAAESINSRPVPPKPASIKPASKPASIKIETSTTAADKVRADLLAVPVFADRTLGAGAELVAAALAGSGDAGSGDASDLDEFMVEADFSGKRGETLAVPTQGKLGAKAVILIGVGDADTFDADAIRRAGATLAKRGRKVARLATTLLEAAPESVAPEAAAQALAEGVFLGAYQFLKYKGDAPQAKLSRVLVLGRNKAKVKAAIARGARVATAVMWARDLVNEPAGAKSPQEVAELAKGVARQSGLKVKVFSGAQLERERMGGVIGVGPGFGARTAIRPARLRARGREEDGRVRRQRASCSTPVVSPSRPRREWRR